jgi:hypothetical protein
MATLEGLSLSISADVKDLLKGLDTGKKSITDFVSTGEASLQTLGDAYKVLQQKQQQATNPTELKRYNAALKEIDGAKKGLVSLSTDMGKFSQSTNVAGQSLTNLGRIAQDAPFGFIGIQNNINPLLESFQRLKVETGSTSGAFKALGASMLGGAGLGLAVSVLTGVLTVLSQNGFFKAAEGADKAAEAIKKNKEALEANKKAIDSIFASTAKEVVNVQSLIAVLNSELVARDRKLDALKDLQKIQPEIFKGVTLEGNAVIGLNAAYASYLQQIKAVIAVKIKQQQLEKVTEDILKKEGVTLSQQEKDYKQAGDAISKSLEQKANVADKANKFVLDRVKKENSANASLEKDYKTQASLLQEITSLQAGIKIPDQKEKTNSSAKSVKNYSDIIEEFRKNIAGLQAQLTQGLISKDALDEGIVKALTSTIGKLGEIKAPIKIQSDLVFEFTDNIYRQSIKKFTERVINKTKEEPLEIPLDVKIEANVSDGALTALAESLNRQNLQQRLADLGVSNLKAIGINLPITVATSTKQLEAVYAAVQAKTSELNANFSQAFNAGFQQVFTGAFENLGNSIGAALSGGDFGKNLGQGFFGLIGDFVSSMGKQLIQVYALAKLTQLAFKNILKNPALTLVAGVGLVALGAAMKNVAAKGFATGGYVSGPGTKTSDSIPANLSRGEYVIKAAAVDKFGVGFLNSINSLSVPNIQGNSVGSGAASIEAGGGSINLAGEFLITGDTLRLLLNRANQTYSRNT